MNRPTIFSLLVVASIAAADEPATTAGEERIERCRTPPKVIVTDAKQPAPTGRPPVGTVVVELTVMTDGTIRDVLVVEPVDSQLRRWAIETSRDLRFAPVGKACRTRLTLESRITDGA